MRLGWAGIRIRLGLGARLPHVSGHFREARVILGSDFYIII